METHDTAYHLLEATASHAHADHTDEWHFESPVSEGHFRKTQRLLYTSHFLSTWNSRLFEFGAYLFLAAIYPQTLLPASVYALTRAGSAAIVTPWLGHYVDTGERLAIVRISIGSQRIAVAISCLLLLAMAQLSVLRESHIYSALVLTGLCALAAVEKLSSVINTISVERDWVVVVANGNEGRLRILNSQMRRIDLFSKLVGPLAISFVDVASTRIAIMVTGAMTVASAGIEYFAIARVYHTVPALMEHRSSSQHTSGQTNHNSRTILTTIKAASFNVAAYITHPTFLPSFALALLYLTVLSFAGQMITYLLAMGVSSGILGIIRAIAAVSELSATWLAPKIMKSIGAIRAGIWFLNWQILCVAIACAFLWLGGHPTLTAVGTVTAVIASRLGLWGFDLCAQIIVQDEVESDRRGAFSSQEFALQNSFEMLAFLSTVIWVEPKHFAYPATISAAAVALAGVLYAAFVRMRRGHLVHLSKCMNRGNRKKHGWTSIDQEEEDLDGQELVVTDTH